MNDAIGGDPTGESLGPGREFDIIRELVARWGQAARGIGGDAATLTVPPGEQLVASIDASLEGVHFRRDWITAHAIGYRAVASALSDLAAMAATPLGILIALSIPEEQLPDLSELADGIEEAAAASGSPIVGGDTTRGPTLTLTITVLGHATRPVRRRGARPGHFLYVTGALGGPSAAVQALASGTPPVPAHFARFAHPVPRLRESLWLAEHGAAAMIDVSDGVASDVRHLAAASNVSIEVSLDRLPCVDGVEPLQAVRGGEEYELLCAAASLDQEEFQKRFGVALTCIGRVTVSGVSGVTFTWHDARVDPGLGYEHFSF